MSCSENHISLQIEIADEDLIEVGVLLAAAVFLYVFQIDAAGKENNDKR